MTIPHGEKNAIQNNLKIQSARHEMAMLNKIEKNEGEFFPTVQFLCSLLSSNS